MCTNFHELIQVERADYENQLKQRKAYFDKLTGEDVWEHLIERDFQKRFFYNGQRNLNKFFVANVQIKKSASV